MRAVGPAEPVDPRPSTSGLAAGGPSAPASGGRRHGLLTALATAAPGPALPWRAVGAALLLLCAGVHLYLYAGEQYHEIPTVGPLFVMTGVVATVLAVAAVTVRRPLVDLAGAAFGLSVLGGYLLTLYLPNGLFLFKEPGISYSGGLAIFSEVGAAVALVVAAWLAVLPAVRRARS